ncbi:hypothetical protein EKO04_010520 [Ascochyta lentis]|uniref:Phytanoyl-CoA dioxygenase n=1 Tax=Ascochyta lentis TaxID=205686 RepID=A0A8H7IV70_9PLEO|nr:hypothetical protein EKO04_010520 [Ascochyta lentis]
MASSSSAVSNAKRSGDSTAVPNSSVPKDAGKDKKSASMPAKDESKDSSKGGNDEASSNIQTRAIPDTLDVRLAVHELRRSENPSSSERIVMKLPEEGADGPLFLALWMGNNNNNANAAAQPARQPAPQPAPQPDTLDTRFAVHEVLGPSSGEVSHIDGPLLFALLLNNQNNNNNNPNAAAQTAPQPDTLDMRFAAHEVLEPTGSEASHEDGPLLLTLLLTNQNQNLNPQPALMQDLVPDTLDSRLAVMEVTGSQHDDMPPVLKMRGAAQPPLLADEQVQFYRDNGYLVVPDALSSQTVADLLQCVHESAEAVATGGPGVRKQEFNKWEKGCVNPNGRVIAALTERAFQPNTTPLQHIQRLGCGVHRVLPPFRRAIMSTQHADVAKSLGYTDPRVVQSLVIVKAAQVGGKVVPHQDGCTSFTDPPSCTTFWYALEDANVENGCLAVSPRSHIVTPIMRRFRQDDNGMPQFEALEDAVFADISNTSAHVPAPERDEEGGLVFKELEVKAGTLVLMHGNLMHTSAANTSGKSRVAFNFGVVEGGLEWKEDNYLQPYEGTTEFEKLRGC